MTWTTPEALGFLAAPLAALVLAVALFRWKSRVARRLGDPAVLARLYDPRTGRMQRVKTLLALLGFVLLVLAAAGPRWGQDYQEVQRRGVDVLIAIDVSASMLAEDIAPNRLTQAKRELGLLINGLEGDRVGVVAFAGAAFLQCPLTLDYGAARSLLDLVGPDMIPKPGTSLADAILTSVDAFPAGSKKHRVLVLLTDGEDHSGRLDAAVKKAEDEGVRILSIGFGSATGEIIPLRDEKGALIGYKKDKKGETVTSKMDQAALEKMAADTRGAFFPASQGEVEVARLLEEIRGMEKMDLESRVYGTGENHFVWPLWAAFLLLILEFFWPETPGQFRRVIKDLRSIPWRAGRPLIALIAFVSLAAPGLAMGRYPESKELAPAVDRHPKDPRPLFELAHALFNEGQFAASAETFAKSADNASSSPAFKSAALYNAGNALVRDQKLDAAIEKFKAALRADPSDPDAKHNLEILQRHKKEQKPSDKQKPDPQQKNEDNKNGADAKPQMSREDAERLLQAIAEQEKNARQKDQKEKPPEAPGGNDW